ncbi:rod-determining factor RdfA [Halobellus captivus]|uniref:rod-determining factor RdfA n=1 Tax=Halobellus captivus TaxID=2592614 RepID=UPI0011A08342|nr:rod-determining factor RdfA [Halobellus captivus]
MTKSSESTRGTTPHSRSASKVAKLIHQYDLGDIGTELEERWTREENRMSLRTLAEYFNTELLAAALRKHSTNILEGEAENYYRLLTDEDVSSGTRIQAENKLEQQEIDVEALRSDFVSRQAIHTYLTKERETAYEREEQTRNERISSRIDTIRRLKNRVVAVSEQILSELAKLGDVSSSATRVSVLVQVTCDHCGSQYPFAEFISNGGCECKESRE